MVWGTLEGGIDRVRTAIGGSATERNGSGTAAGATDEGTGADSAVEGMDLDDATGRADDDAEGATGAPTGTGRLDWSVDDATEVENRLETLLEGGIETEEEPTEPDGPPGGLENAFTELEGAAAGFEWVDATELESARG